MTKESFICREEDCSESFDSRGPRNHHESRVHDGAEFIEERFSESWEENGDGCWVWNGPHTSDGYGYLQLYKRQKRAHRVSYKIHKGPIDDQKQINHMCHLKTCVNPDHLYQGTHQDNMDDSVEVGTFEEVTRRGEDASNAKLTEKEVKEIRHAYESSGIYQYELADEYGVDQSLISLVVNGKKWNHVE